MEIDKERTAAASRTIQKESYDKEYKLVLKSLFEGKGYVEDNIEVLKTLSAYYGTDTEKGKEVKKVLDAVTRGAVEAKEETRKINESLMQIFGTDDISKLREIANSCRNMTREEELAFAGGNSYAIGWRRRIPSIIDEKIKALKAINPNSFIQSNLKTYFTAKETQTAEKKFEEANKSFRSAEAEYSKGNYEKSKAAYVEAADSYQSIGFSHNRNEVNATLAKAMANNISKELKERFAVSNKADRKKYGKEVTRLEAHKLGIEHLNVNVMLFAINKQEAHFSNKRIDILLQQRAENKDLFPLKPTLSACGHVKAGESIIEAAIGEVRDETGFRNINKKRLESGRIGKESEHKGYLGSFEFIPLTNNEAAKLRDYVAKINSVEKMSDEKHRMGIIERSDDIVGNIMYELTKKGTLTVYTFSEDKQLLLERITAGIKKQTGIPYSHPVKNKEVKTLYLLVFTDSEKKEMGQKIANKGFQGNSEDQQEVEGLEYRRFHEVVDEFRKFPEKYTDALTPFLSDKKVADRIIYLNTIHELYFAQLSLDQKIEACINSMEGEKNAIFAGVDSKRDTVKALAEIGPAAKKAIPALLTLIEGNFHYNFNDACAEGASTLAKIDPTVDPKLIKDMKSETQTVRKNAVAKARIYFTPKKTRNLASGHSLEDDIFVEGLKKMLADYSHFEPRHLEAIKILFALGQDGLFAGWAAPGTEDELKKNFLDQVIAAENAYPGGLAKYQRNAIKTIDNSVRGVNPFKGLAPEVPDIVNIDTTRNIDDRYKELERHGLSIADKLSIVLVAGGRGDRLGYNGIKIGIPVDLITGRRYVEHFLEGKKAIEEARNTRIPFAVMTSDDNHETTKKLFQELGYSVLSEDNGMTVMDKDGDAVNLMMQGLVPAVKNVNGDFALESPYKLLVKPHGHGDVHMLVKQHGLIDEWIKAGKKYTVFIQDTNGQVLNAILSGLAVSDENRLDLSFVTVQRDAGEAAGAIIKLSNPRNKKDIVCNVEYNQLSPLLQEAKGTDDVADPATGKSPYPANLNVYFIENGAYKETLEKTEGIMPEFANPKFTDSSKTTFQPTRLETMMQDIAMLLPEAATVGVVNYLDKRAIFSPVKNSFEGAVKKVETGNYPDHMATGEGDHYRHNRRLLSFAGMRVNEEGIQKLSQGKIPYREGAKVSFYRNFATTAADVLSKVKGGSITDRSVLVINGEDVYLEDVNIDGALIISTAPGVSLRIKDLEVRNNGWQFAQLTAEEMGDPEVSDYLKIRGYRLVKKDQMAINIKKPGNYEMGRDGILRRSGTTLASAKGVRKGVSEKDAKKLLIRIVGKITKDKEEKAKILDEIIPNFIASIIDSNKWIDEPEKSKPIIALRKNSLTILSIIKKAIELKAAYGDFYISCKYTPPEYTPNYVYNDPNNADYDVIDGHFWTEPDYHFMLYPRINLTQLIETPVLFLDGDVIRNPTSFRAALDQLRKNKGNIPVILLTKETKETIQGKLRGLDLKGVQFRTPAELGLQDLGWHDMDQRPSLINGIDNLKCIPLTKALCEKFQDLQKARDQV